MNAEPLGHPSRILQAGLGLSPEFRTRLLSQREESTPTPPDATMQRHAPGHAWWSKIWKDRGSPLPTGRLTSVLPDAAVLLSSALCGAVPAATFKRQPRAQRPPTFPGRRQVGEATGPGKGFLPSETRRARNSGQKDLVPEQRRLGRGCSAAGEQLRLGGPRRGCPPGCGGTPARPGPLHRPSGGVNVGPTPGTASPALGAPAPEAVLGCDRDPGPPSPDAPQEGLPRS